MNLQGQDWDSVVINKSNRPAKKSTGKGPVVPGQTETVKKHAASTNKAHAGTSSGKDARRVDDETEDFSHTRVSASLSKQIQQARIAKGLTQAQLGQAINEKAQIIQTYENGSAIPNPQVLNKLSRTLGVRLSNKAQQKK